jgi:hypothetical protein
MAAIKLPASIEVSTALRHKIIVLKSNDKGLLHSDHIDITIARLTAGGTGARHVVSRFFRNYFTLHQLPRKLIITLMF